MASATRIRNIKFTTGRVIKGTRTAAAKAFKQVAKEMTTVLKKVVSKPYPPASTPGRPPHMRRPAVGLRSQTEVVPRGRTLVVKTTQVGVWLDGGTSRMRARPFIRKNIHDKRRFWERRINTLIRQNTA